MAYGIANLGSGFIQGFDTVDSYYRNQHNQKITGDANRRAQEEHDRKMADIEANRADGEILTREVSGWFGIQPPQRGVQMGPPTPDGQWAEQPAPGPEGSPPPGVMPPGGAPVQRPLTSLAEAQKEARARIAKIAPTLVRMYARADPTKAAEFATKISDLDAQGKLADQVALGKLLLTNPASPETRNALVEWYKDIPDGKDIDPKTYRVDEKGNIHFSTVHESGERVPEVLTPAQIRGMAIQALTLPQIVDTLRADDKAATDKAHTGVVEQQGWARLELSAREADDRAKDREADNKRAEKEFGIRMQEIRDARADRNENLRLNREARGDAVKARERDEVFNGVVPVFIGDKNAFPTLSPEEQQDRLQQAGDAVDIVELNKMGKTSRDGLRAAAYIKQIASGQARVFAHKSDPSLVIVDVGGTKLMMPKESYTMSLYNKASISNQIPK